MDLPIGLRALRNPRRLAPALPPASPRRVGLPVASQPRGILWTYPLVDAHQGARRLAAALPPECPIGQARPVLVQDWKSALGVTFCRCPGRVAQKGRAEADLCRYSANLLCILLWAAPAAPHQVPPVSKSLSPAPLPGGFLCKALFTPRQNKSACAPSPQVCFQTLASDAPVFSPRVPNLMLSDAFSRRFFISPTLSSAPFLEMLFSKQKASLLGPFLYPFKRHGKGPAPH